MARARSATRTTVFKLPGSMTVAHAQALRDALLPLVPQARLTLDGSAVDSVGVAGLQVLAALMRSRGERSTHWHAVSPALLDAARVSGLTQALALPSSTTPENAA